MSRLAHRRNARHAPAIVAAALLACILALAPGRHGGLSGASLDTMFWLRHQIFGSRHAGNSPVVVVGIDESTYRSPDFKNKPRVLWTPEFAKILDIIAAAQPAAVGLDVVFPTSAASVLPNFDREFLLALRRLANDRKVVLGKVQSQTPPLLPFAAQVFAVGGGGSVRSTNLPEDRDVVIRRGVLLFPRTDGQPPEPSFALELASRAGHVSISRSTRGVALGDYRVPGSSGGDFLLNFDGGPLVPTVSLADLFACASAGQTATVEKAFRGKVVLIGTVLGVEDRVTTSRRWINAGEADRVRLCGGPTAASGESVRQTLPGVYAQATAIDNLLRHEVLAAPGDVARYGIVLATAILGGGAALLGSLVQRSVALGSLTFAIVAGATALFDAGFAAPMLEAAIATLLAFALVTLYRLLVADGERRRIRRTFGLYTAPEVVDAIVAAGSLPSLGGERREITVLFSDLENFTTLCEILDPQELTALLNTYFDALCGQVIEAGGLVVDLLGDGVMALFGAPLAGTNHARQAVHCARGMDRVADAFSAAQRAKGLAFGRTRIGVHTGPAVVGSFGSLRHLKYSALGDTINTCKRIETLNKQVRSAILASRQVCDMSGDPDVRPVGNFMLKGKRGAVEVFQVLDVGAGQSDAHARYRRAYAAMTAHAPEAAALFSSYCRDYPDDFISGFYRNRLLDGVEQPALIQQAIEAPQKPADSAAPDPEPSSQIELLPAPTSAA